MVGIFLRKIRDKTENIISVRIKIRLEVDYYRKEDYKLYKRIKASVHRVNASKSSVY